ncbi:hypothetical protein AB0L06_43230 [Spirillospora sp. NPDC052269]
MTDEPGERNNEKLAAWLGVAASVLAILGWFGFTDWHHFASWMKHQDHASPSSTYTAPPLSVSKPTSPARVSSSPSRSTLDPGCIELGQALHSFTASQDGRPSSITRDRARTLAIEYQGFARSLDRAAMDARGPQVKEAIRAYASDTRTLADDLDAYDLDAFHRVNGTMGNEVIAACSHHPAE